MCIHELMFASFYLVLVTDVFTDVLRMCTYRTYKISSQISDPVVKDETHSRTQDSHVSISNS
jgi:hypothetical protein